jgi:hypothetical protein
MNSKKEHFLPRNRPPSQPSPPYARSLQLRSNVIVVVLACVIRKVCGSGRGYWYAGLAYRLKLGRLDSRRPENVKCRVCVEVFLVGFDVGVVVMRAVTEKMTRMP